MVDYLSISYEELKEKDKFNSIAICAKYDEAKEIIAKLVCSGYGIASIDRFDSEEYGRYYDEYVISLLEDQIWCEPAKRNGKYIFVEADVVYIFDNCNSKIIPKIEAGEVYEVEIGNEYDNCDDGCENSEEEGFTVNGKPVSKEEFDNYTSQFKHDEKPTTTTASKESYFINGKSVDKSEFDKKYEELEEMYMDNIRNIMLDYCNFMDSVNDWRNRILRW